MRHLTNAQVCLNIVRFLLERGFLCNRLIISFPIFFFGFLLSIFMNQSSLETNDNFFFRSHITA